jgi:alpha-tubulin suppressor-like RCC1 family protein
MAGSNYNFTENGQVIPFEDAFVRVEQFQNDLYGLGSRVGDNTIATRSTPRQEFTSSSNWKSLSNGPNGTSSGAIKTDGTLWVWGTNYSGSLGVNDTTNRNTPTQEWTSSTNWKQVISGYRYMAAIKTDGTLWAWGDNGDGQLGDNTNIERSTPKQIGTATNWRQIACGRQHTLGVKTDGTLWTWGSNYQGILGHNDTVSRSTPTQLGTETTWKQVSGGYQISAAIKTDGTLWAWGRGRGLGVYNTTNRFTPVQEFTSSTNWKQLSCGTDRVGAIKTDGTLWAWGTNTYGQLGDNTIATRSTPRQEFTSSTNWKQITCGNNHTAAIKTDGTLWTWGRNNQGQLGDNTTADRLTPIQEFTSSTNWKQVSTRINRTTAIKAEDYPRLY